MNTVRSSTPSTVFTRAIRATALAVGAAMVAIVRYPGGTMFDARAPGYTWSQNFLSDLGMTVAYDGRPNMIGAACFVTAIAALVVGLGGALVGFLRRYAVTANARRLRLPPAPLAARRVLRSSAWRSHLRIAP